jgi:hypothetical protein
VLETAAAATFESARGDHAAAAATAHAPTKRPLFAPPSPPRLRDERDAMSGTDLERIRDHNESLIRGYNAAYGRYLETYVEGVKAAPSLDRVRAFGPPVDYDPAAPLPASQRAVTTTCTSPRHEQKAVHDPRRHKGARRPEAPGRTASSTQGDGVRQRRQGARPVDADGAHGEASTQVGLKLQAHRARREDRRPQRGVGFTTNIDAETGEVTNAAGGAGRAGIEATDHGKVSMDSGHWRGRATARRSWPSWAEQPTGVEVCRQVATSSAEAARGEVRPGAA